MPTDKVWADAVRDATSQMAAAHPHVYKARIHITSIDSCILPFSGEFVKKRVKPPVL
jgi:hypothetical protein